MARTAQSIPWIELPAVRVLVEKAFLSSTYIKIWTRDQLIPGLVAGRVRWRARASTKPSDGFFQQPDATFIVDWQKGEVASRIWPDNNPASPMGMIYIGQVTNNTLYGVQLMREDVEVLLPKDPDASAEEVQPTKPAEQKLGPDDWLAWARKKYPRRRDEKTEAHINSLHELMQKANNVTEIWPFATFRRRYFEQIKAERKR